MTYENTSNTPDTTNRVVEFVANDGYVSSTAETVSITIASVNDAPSGSPVIVGTAAENQTLTADTSGLTDADGLGSFSYQWYRDTGSGAVAIGGATGSTYTLGDSDVGAVMSVAVSYVDTRGTSEGPLTSSSTSTVTNVNDAPSGSPVIVGTAAENQTLTADTSGLTDADGLGSFSYQWYRDTGSGAVAIGGATGSTYTLGDSDVGAVMSVAVSYVDTRGTSEGPLTSSSTSTVTNVNDAPSGSPVIVGTAAENQTLTADTSGLTDADGLGSFSYQWYRDTGSGAVAIGGATGSTYTLGDSDVGAVMSVAVSYVDTRGTSEGPLTSSSTSTVTNVNDAPSGSPVIVGTAAENQTLTADTSGLTDADGLGSFSYQWYRDTGSGAVAIGGATGSTYTLGDSDVGAVMSVAVSYVDTRGTSEGPLTSSSTSTVTNVNDAPSGSPVIVGTAAENQTLTADTSGLTDADGLGSFSYQWYRDTGSGAVAIGGATGSTYTLGDSDVGAVMSVAVSYVDTRGTSEGPLTSSSTSTVTNVNDAPSGSPVIVGTAAENQTLTADTSGLTDADGLGSFSYQWYRDTGSGAVAIGGATGSTYTLGDSDVGAVMSVAVSYVDTRGTSEGPLTSSSTSTVTNVNDAPSGSPVIVGTAAENQTLTADTSGLTDADGLGSFSYQWYRDTGSGAVAIGGATGSTYTLGDSDVGAVMSVAVSYVDTRGTSEGPLTSSSTSTVTNVNDAPSGSPVIVGTAAENQTLTADTSGLTDADGLGSFSYQWYRDTGSGAVAIGGATGSTYTLGDSDVGAVMSVAVSYVDTRGTSEGPLTSSSTSTVTNVNDAPSGSPVIVGTAAENQTLTADTSGLTDADGLGSFSYQWYRDTGSGAVAIGGATGSTYTLGDSDVGAVMSVAVSYVDTRGTSEGPLTSSSTSTVTNVNDAPSGSPVIVGTAAENQTLTADTSGLTDADGLGSFSYQWYRDTGSGAVAIGGATGSTLYAWRQRCRRGDECCGVLCRYQRHVRGPADLVVDLDGDECQRRALWVSGDCRDGSREPDADGRYIGPDGCRRSRFLQLPMVP
ncbi:hypothetical protein [Rhizobium sp. SL86]|uniref:hypothetical protein n=1 Tax=Rhizobium sp. SL86 TaxID=2995148 RepID=UPI0022742618|nr:hypothetical protein [Rhizobium sp. SL86]MCY1667733.1 hypothetical protein [Rhizobium sp. SL86]